MKRFWSVLQNVLITGLGLGMILSIAWSQTSGDKPEVCPMPEGIINHRQAFENDLMKAVQEVVEKHTKTVDVLSISTSTREDLNGTKSKCVFAKEKRGNTVRVILEFKISE